MVGWHRFLSNLFFPRLTRSTPAVKNHTRSARGLKHSGCLLLLLWLLEGPAIGADYFANLSFAHLEAGKALLNKGEMDEAINEFQVAIRLNPTNAEAHSNLGYALGRKGDPNGAIAAYREALQLQLADQEYAEAQFNLGYALGWKGDLGGAIAAWREGIRVRPDDASTRTTLGMALHKRGGLERAIGTWSDLARRYPDNAVAHFGLAVALGQKGDREGEIRAYRNTIRLQPHHPLAFVNLGIALGRAGDRHGELTAYREAIRLQPDNPNYGEIHVQLAMALEQQGEMDEATAAWRRGLQLNRTARLSHPDLGSGVPREGYVEHVMAVWHDIIRLDFRGLKETEIHHRVGEALAQKGVWEEAIRVYQELVQLKPEDTVARHTLMKAHHQHGLSLLETGQVEQAVEAFHLALQLDPSYPPAKRDLQTALHVRNSLSD